MSASTFPPVWLEGLNKQQKQAVLHGEAPLLILAGAGSGKTKVICSRIAWMVGKKGFDARSILALTFTNKAAEEMRDRVTAMVPDAHGAMTRTFHSFGAWLLRRNAAAAKLSVNFTIYDDDDQVSLLAGLLDGMPRRELRLWTHRIARAKDEGLSPDDDLTSVFSDPAFSDVYRRYEKRLRDIGNVDFGDLVLMPIKLLRNRPEIKKRLRKRFIAVLVDEYQDTNVAQYQLLRELVGPDTWLAVVGDDDQSIYGFRGAQMGNILGFSTVFSGTKVIRLEQNYRSTATILDIASSVVAHNTGRLGKVLWTAGEQGEKAILTYLENHDAEADWCAHQVMEDGNLAGTAILYRTNAQSRVFETVFRKLHIPHRVVGTLSFYQREEVKDVLAYLSWLANPKDEVAFRRIANKPARGLGKTGLNQLIESAAIRHGGDILQACHSTAMKPKAAAALCFLIELTERYQDGSAFEHLGMLIQDLTDTSGLLDYYREVDRIESSRRTRNLEELVNAAAEYPSSPEGLTAFLELVELDQMNLEEGDDDAENRVTLITMHNTKGLEFDRVFITGMEEGLFPRGDEGFDDEELEEERRLFYVAITRARKQLAFTCCRRRMQWGRYRECLPSRFLEEIPKNCIRIHGGAGESDSAVDSWNPGVRLYHEDYGAGVVQKRIANGGHTVIHVLFESGRQATLLPEFSSHQMEILGAVGEDW